MTKEKKKESTQEVKQITQSDDQNLTFDELAHGFGVEKIIQLQQKKTIKAQAEQIKKLQAELQG